MYLQVLLASLLLSGSALASGLCIQGCCGLTAKLPTRTLALMPNSGSSGIAVQELPLENLELPCCPCPENDAASAAEDDAQAAIRPPRPYYSCAEGDCEPAYCTCDQGARQSLMPRLRRLCPAGQCEPKQCMCLAELLQGIHDTFFYDYKLVSKNSMSSGANEDLTSHPHRIAYSCAEGDCEPAYCTCDQSSTPRERSKPQLRRLCSRGQCEPATCMCFEELLQGVHDYFFHDYTLVAKNSTHAATGTEHLARVLGQQNVIGEKSEL